MPKFRLHLRIACLGLALALLGAAPAAQVIVPPKNFAYSETALIIPADSPVKFRRWNANGVAEFDGKFVLTGKFIYSCGLNCEEGGAPWTASDLQVTIEPDPQLTARLPRWRNQRQDMLISISSDEHFAGAISTHAQRASLLSGKIPDVSGRISILVEKFEASMECDSASFSVRFVAIAEAPKVATVEFNGEYGCGFL